jgi:hypothetical protein
MRERRRPMRLEPRNPPSDVPHDGLRSWDEVAHIWRLRSGERLTRQGVCYVAQSGIRKLRKAIENDPRLCGDLGVDELED